MEKKYYLYLELNNKKSIEILSGTLKEIDEFTILFNNAKDLSNELNRLYNKNYNIKELKIKSDYSKDTIPVKYQTDNYNEEEVKERYFKYLLSDRTRIPNSFIKYINIGINITSTITEYDLKRIFMAYYKKNNYKKIRDTYFYLKLCGQYPNNYSQEIIKEDRKNITNPHFKNPNIESLYKENKYDEIFNLYDLDDMHKEDIKKISRGRI